MPTSRRLRFGIGTAIVFSVLLHLVAAPFVRFAQASPLPEATDQPLSIDLTTPRPIPPTPPPPTPTPRPVITPPPALPLPHAVPNVVHPRVADIPRRMRAPRLTPDASGARRTSGETPSIGGDGRSPGSVPDAAAGPASPSPLEASQEPTPAPKVTCDRPDVAARTVAVVDPELSEIARERNMTGTVDVRVDLTETGEVRAVSIASSPDVSLDEAALDAARRSTYAPEVVDCKAQSGSYLFRVEFDG